MSHDALGGDEGETSHAPCVRRGGVNGYSHLLNGSAEACLQPSRVGDASMMLNEDMGSSGNHFGSTLVTSTFAAARSAAAHGDDFTAFLRLHTLTIRITFLHNAFQFAPFSILIEIRRSPRWSGVSRFSETVCISTPRGALEKGFSYCNGRMG